MDSHLNQLEETNIGFGSNKLSHESNNFSLVVQDGNLSLDKKENCDNTVLSVRREDKRLDELNQHQLEKIIR